MKTISTLLLAVSLFAQGPTWREADIDGRRVRFQIIDGYAMEGDIILGPASEFNGKSPRASSVVRRSSRLWLKGIVPYVPPSLPNKQMILDAINAFTAVVGTETPNPPILFRPANQTDKDYIQFETGTTCASSIGRLGGPQTITVGGCSTTAQIIHELGHALGLNHTQARQDRDFYVEVSYPSLNDRATFSQYNQDLTESQDAGPYPYDSIMHYNEDQFSVPKRFPLLTIPRGIPIGRRNSLAPSDIDSIIRLYGQQPPLTFITANPPGPTLTIADSSNKPVNINDPAYNWPAGKTFTLSAPTERPCDGVSCVFVGWSNFGPREQEIARPEATTFYTANYRRMVEVDFRADVRTNGTVAVDPLPENNRLAAGSTATLTAVAAPGYTFLSWTSESGLTPTSANPLEIGISAFVDPEKVTKVRYTAQFTKDPVTTITSIPPGLELKVNGKKVQTPYRDTWPTGNPLDIEAPTQPGVFPNSGTEYQVLKSWSRAHTAGPDPIVASFSAVHSVRWVAPRIGDGTVTFSPALLPGNLVAGDTELTITAVPGAGSGFISWGDSLSGSDPSVKFKVNSDLVISARFGVVGLLSAAGTVNAASQLRSPLSPEGFTQIIVAPGQMISLYGAAIGPATTTEVPFPFASNARDLHQTEVLFNGVSSAPVTYVSPNQINCIVPFGVNGKDVPIQVILAGRRSNELKVSVQAAVPAIFTANSSGLGPGVIRNVDGSPNSPSNRAARGSQVTIYATGTGRTTPASLDGEIIRPDAPPPSPELPVKVFIADREVKITSPAVSVPGSVNGLTVLSVLVPDEKTIGPGIVPIVIQVGEFRSPRTASIAVK